jgi:serine/threonine-protein kinase HipA
MVEVSGEALETLAITSVGKGKTVAGVQRKLSVHLSEVHGAHRLTLVGYPSGFILKPQTPEYPQLPELEHVTMSLSARVGIKTVPHGLIKLADGSLAYITRRIDREVSGTRRLPMEDMCQLSERLTEDKYRGSYEQVAKVVARHSSRPGIDETELFMTLLFCFVTGNADMHLKNFSLFRPVGGWVLAPAYDLVATAVVLPDDDEETALTLNGKKRKLRRQDFLAFGTTAGIHEKAVVRLLETVLHHSETMPTLIEDSPLSPSARERFTEIVRERAKQLRK